MKLPFLKVNKTGIKVEAGKRVVLKGVALGGWLMMEGYMMCGRNIAEKAFKENLAKALGKEALEDFTKAFRETFIREEDFSIIKSWGANCVRVPFNYRLIEFEDRPFSLNEGGLKFLDQVVEWCRKYSLYCILDMHAVPGAQNPDWHSDCVDKYEFFTDTFNQDRIYRLWRFLADRYSNVSEVAGYDVINEPIIALSEEGKLKAIYERITEEIRDVDPRHIIFLEGSEWASRLAFLGHPKDENTAYSIHTYPPTDFTFNWMPDLKYPLRSHGIMLNRKTLNFLAKQYINFAKKNNVHLYVGEFGVNWRGGFYGELDWVRDMLSVFKENKVSWTYWTYKTAANFIFPDGIFRYVKNPAWINRKGPVTGWENFYTLWQKERDNIIESWKTENFKRNDKLFALLKRNF